MHLQLKTADTILAGT